MGASALTPAHPSTDCGWLVGRNRIYACHITVACTVITLRFDGLFRGVPRRLDSASSAGFMCYGWLITRQGAVLAQGHGAFFRNKNANSNIAEYLALIEGLDAMMALDIGAETIEVCGDAKSIIDQMAGAAMVNAPSVRPLHRRAQQLAGQLPNVWWIWLPRKNNREADTLSRRAMRQLRLDRNYYLATTQAITADPQQGKLKNGLLPFMDLRVYTPVPE